MNDCSIEHARTCVFLEKIFLAIKRRNLLLVNRSFVRIDKDKSVFNVYRTYRRISCCSSNEYFLRSESLSHISMSDGKIIKSNDRITILDFIVFFQSSFFYLFNNGRLNILKFFLLAQKKIIRLNCFLNGLFFFSHCAHFKHMPATTSRRKLFSSNICVQRSFV